MLPRRPLQLAAISTALALLVSSGPLAQEEAIPLVFQEVLDVRVVNVDRDRRTPAVRGGLLPSD